MITKTNDKQFNEVLENTIYTQVLDTDTVIVDGNLVRSFKVRLIASGRAEEFTYLRSLALDDTHGIDVTANEIITSILAESSLTIEDLSKLGYVGVELEEKYRKIIQDEERLSSLLSPNVFMKIIKQLNDLEG